MFHSGRPVPLTALLLFCAAALAAQTPPAVFRSGVDVVQMDVTVLDKDRKPVRGLTAADFTVSEDGKPRSIVTFTPYDLPPPAAPAADAASWTRDVTPDVATNAVSQEGRLVVILFDWSIRFEDQKSARKIATAAVNALGPGDEAAVIFSSGFANAGTPQNFTSDRARLLDAINRPIASAMHEPDVQGQDTRNFNKAMLHDPEGYESGDCHCRVCVMDAITRIADMVRDVPNRRKTLLFIGTYFQAYEYQMPIPPGPPPAFPPEAPIQNPVNWGVCTEVLHTARDAMGRSTGLANLTIHVLDPAGLTSLGSAPLGGGDLTLMGSKVITAQAVIAKTQDDLHIMPDMTGGRTVVNTNAPEEMVPAIFQESQSYYVLAVERGSQTNYGKVHNLDVKVNRPGVSVQYRKGYVADDALAAATTGAAAAPLKTTLDRVLPLPDLPLTVTVEPFATPGAAQPAAIGMVIGVREPTSPQVPAGEKETETILAATFDTKGQSLSTAHQSVNVWPPTGPAKETRYEVLSRLPAEPGRYEVRVAVDIAPDRRGSVSTFVDVPDFAKAALSLSGIVLGTTPATPAASADMLKDLIPIVPTAKRAFAGADHATSFLRVYQGGTGKLEPVALSVRIVDSHGTSKFDDTRMLDAAAFGTARAADYRLELPLDRLEPGEHLLSVQAKRGSTTAARDLRFTVVPASRQK